MVSVTLWKHKHRNNMKHFLFTLALGLICYASTAQRVPVDSVKFTCHSSTGSSTGNPFFIENAAPGYFWSAYIPKKVGGTASHSVWNGHIHIDKRDTATMNVVDSVTYTGMGTILEVESDDAGNLYLLGFVTKPLTISNSITIDSNKHFLLKVNTSLQPVWINDSVVGDHFSVSPNGQHIYVRGDRKGFGGTVDLYKLSANGNILQTKQLTKIGYIGDIKTNNNGDVFFSGSCISNSAQLDTLDASHTFSYTIYYGKLDSNMVATWIKILEDITCPTPWLDLDANGNILFFSSLYKSNTLGQFQMDVKNQEFILSSTTTSGSVNYAHDAPGNTHKVPVPFNSGRGISTHASSVAILVSQNGYTDTINWGNGIQTVSDIWLGRPLILEYDINSGQLLMASNPDYSTDKYYNSLLYLDNGDLLVSNTSYDSTLVIVKMRMPSSTGIEEINTNKLSAYPNPTDGLVHFSQPLSGIVYSVTGIKMGELREASILDMSNYPSGFYYVRSVEGDRIKLLKK